MFPCFCVLKICDRAISSRPKMSDGLLKEIKGEQNERKGRKKGLTVIIKLLVLTPSSF